MVEGIGSQRFELMPGEDPGTEATEDAKHWVTVYGQLAAMALETRLNDRLLWFRERESFWRRRYKELRDRLA